MSDLTVRLEGKELEEYIAKRFPKENTVTQTFTPPKHEPMSVQDSVEIEKVYRALIGYVFPKEWEDNEQELNARHSKWAYENNMTSEDWVIELAHKAKDIFLTHYNSHFHGKASSWISSKDSFNLTTEPLSKTKNIKEIKMNFNYPLTKSMAATGWKHYCVTVRLITREEAGVWKQDPAEAKALYKSMSIPVNLWACPEVTKYQHHGVLLCKVKTEGKYLPCNGDVTPETFIEMVRQEGKHTWL